MDTGHINTCLADVPGFVGTFPCNQLPTLPVIRERTLFLVVNTARLRGKTRQKVVQGEHWVALAIHADKSSEYFDSFGLPPDQEEIMKYISANSHRGCSYNTQMIQNPLSSTCGVYCVDFIVSRARGETLDGFVSSFKTNFLLNDRKTVERVTRFLKQRRIKPPLEFRKLMI